MLNFEDDLLPEPITGSVIAIPRKLVWAIIILFVGAFYFVYSSDEYAYRSRLISEIPILTNVELAKTTMESYGFTCKIKYENWGDYYGPGNDSGDSYLICINAIPDVCTVTFPISNTRVAEIWVHDKCSVKRLHG